MTMIEAIQQTAQTSRIFPMDPQGQRPKPGELGLEQKKMHEAALERQNESPGKRPEEAQQAKETSFPSQLIEAIEEDLKLLHNVGISFTLHKETGRTIIKIIDKETDELIREVPPEQFLDLAAKIHEMVGILFDKRV